MEFNNVDEIYTALDAARRKFKQTTAHLSDEQARMRENDKGWSVAEIVEHVGIVLNGALMITGKLLAQAETDGGKSDGNFNPPLSFAEQVSRLTDAKLEAPEMVRPQGGKSISESLEKLDASLQALKDLRPRIIAADSSHTKFPHPFLGNLNLYEWLILAGLHERRHLLQIERILAQ